MFFSAALSLLSLPLLAAAQYGYGDPTTTAGTTRAVTSAAAAAATAPANSPGRVNVNVGASGLVFSPPSFVAPNNTVVTFYFADGINHSVTQSSFANPCTYLAANGSSPAGFDSGLTKGKQWSITITNDARPIWFYCKAGKHCGMGMVGAINAPSSGNTFDTFRSAALAIGSAQPAQTDNGPVTGGVGAQATAAPATATGTTAPTNTSGATQLGIGAGAALLAIVVAFISA